MQKRKLARLGGANRVIYVLLEAGWVIVDPVAQLLSSLVASHSCTFGNSNKDFVIWY